MKFKYYFLSVALAATAMVGFTACSDDDEPAVNESKDLAVSQDVTRVKIGSENRVALPVLTGAGDYRAFSLAPEIADIVKGEDGQYYIEGFKNGKTTIVVSDATGTYKSADVSVYTTDNMRLSHTDLSFVTPLGIASSNNECFVAEGNGEYTIESDNPKVVASIDHETGEISLSAKSGKDDYVAVVTVEDCTGLTAQISVTVTPTFDPFTAADIDELMAKDAHDMWLEAPGKGVAYNRTSEYPRYVGYYGNWVDADFNDGFHHIGWGDDFGTNWSYGGQYIYYPTGTAIDTEVDGKYVFQYYYRQNVYNLDGKVKVIRDDAKVTTVIWWDVDMDNECISRGWIVKEK